jgi:hypothetical protein
VRLLLCALLLLTADASAQERFTLAGRDVAIYNLAGALHITAGSGNATEVEVRRVGSDASRLRIATGSIGGASTLRVIYPGDDIVYSAREGHNSETTMIVAEDGTFGRSRDGRRVRISSRSRARRDALEAGADLVVRIPAGVRLLARMGVSETEVRNVNGAITIHNLTGSMVVRGARGELKLNTASGAIEIADTEGDLSVNTASGGVKIENARGNTVKVDVASGSITAAGVRAPTVDFETASGRIRARDIESGRVKMHTASGSIDADLTGKLETVDLGTASGSVNVRLPRDVDATIEIETASGGIDVDFPLKITQQRRNHVRGTIGAGTAQISISTASGGVRVGAL